tara:strand:- start:513 stop:707 length:195 start_codon:yes stop_codon:yes gene_type:complete
MTRTYTKKDLLEELETTTYQIDVLKRTFEKQRENYDEVDGNSYMDYIYKLEDTVLEFKEELEGE